MGLGSDLRNKALGLSQKAMERLFADEKRANQIATAIGRFQQGKAAIDRGQVAVMHQLNFASRADFKALGKQVSALRKRVRELETKLDRL